MQTSPPPTPESGTGRGAGGFHASLRGTAAHVTLVVRLSSVAASLPSSTVGRLPLLGVGKAMPWSKQSDRSRQVAIAAAPSVLRASGRRGVEAPCRRAPALPAVSPASCDPNELLAARTHDPLNQHGRRCVYWRKHLPMRACAGGELGRRGRSVCHQNLRLWFSPSLKLCNVEEPQSTIRLRVGMTCGGCEGAVTRILGKLEGEDVAAPAQLTAPRRARHLLASARISTVKACFPTPQA